MPKPATLLINPPYLTLTSTKGVGHQVPLGLLMVGGALINAGYPTTLLDAECQHLTIPQILEHIRQTNPQIIMTGHAGSTPAHPVCIEMLTAIKQHFPHIITVYGGVYPTYHAREILEKENGVDIIIRGEGEATAVALLKALENGFPLENVAAIAFRNSLHEGGADAIVVTQERPPIDMNDYRIAWELLDHASPKGWDAYQCFGLGRAVILQFSRGCPHHCTYCGQHGFWMKWRHRDPKILAEEIEWLATEKNVRFITFADENPTTLKPVWKHLLQQIAAKNLPVKFFATIRATDIVRDADILPLYNSAGIQYVLMGIETTNPETLVKIKKGSTTRIDLQACQLLRKNHIFSIIGHIVGFGHERFRDFLHAHRQLAHYDGDYLNAMFVMPHAWTPFAQDSAHRTVIEQSQTRWDYRHQVLAMDRLKPWQLFTLVKILELTFHLRPRRILRLLTQSKFSRQQFLWGLAHTGGVYFGEIQSFLQHRHTRRGTQTLAERYAKNLGPHRHAERLTSLRISAKQTPRSARTLQGSHA
jgi:anaerobic magnesium-protoporphyrin IX monomethyl ester cyclase